MGRTARVGQHGNSTTGATIHTVVGSSSTRAATRSRSKRDLAANIGRNAGSMIMVTFYIVRMLCGFGRTGKTEPTAPFNGATAMELIPMAVGEFPPPDPSSRGLNSGGLHARWLWRPPCLCFTLISCYVTIYDLS